VTDEEFDSEKAVRRLALVSSFRQADYTPVKTARFKTGYEEVFTVADYYDLLLIGVPLLQALGI
jgi:hypothetical protein